MLAVLAAISELSCERFSSWLISPAVINLSPATLSTLLNKASVKPLIFDWSIAAADEMSAFKMVPFRILSEVIDSSVTEGKSVNLDPSPTKKTALISPVDEIVPEVIESEVIESEVIVPVNMGEANEALLTFSAFNDACTSMKAEATFSVAYAKFPSAF